MKTSKHPKNLTEDEAAAIVKAFDDAPDDGYVVVEGDALAELRAALAAHAEVRTGEGGEVVARGY